MNRHLLPDVGQEKRDGAGGQLVHAWIDDHGAAAEGRFVIPVDFSQDRCRNPSRSLRSNHSLERRPPSWVDQVSTPVATGRTKPPWIAQIGEATVAARDREREQAGAVWTSRIQLPVSRPDDCLLTGPSARRFESRWGITAVLVAPACQGIGGRLAAALQCSSSVASVHRHAEPITAPRPPESVQP
jgi:hypothetical protein